MKKRLLAILLTLCLIAQLFPLTASAVRAPAPHPSAHCVCGGNHQSINGHTTEEVVYFTKDGKDNASGDISNMNAIQSEAEFRTINNDSINNKGKTFYYYLANDVTIINQVNIGDDCTVVLCLHGHTLTCNISTKDCAFNLWNNARLVITDCQLSGDRGLITGDCRAAAYVPKSSTLDLYGVSICMTSSDPDGLYDYNRTPIGGIHNGGTFNMYGGCPYYKSDQYPTDRPVISNIRNTKNGAGVVNAGTFNMYDGIISGNARHGVLSASIYVEDTINLYGGTITGNTGAGLSTSRWPAPADYENTKYTTVNLYGGTISENTGAGIDAVYGKVTMAQQSSSVPVEIKNNKGGAISLTRNGSSANLGTGTITGNSGGMGAVALTAGSLTLTGDVNITGNTGANLYLADGKTVTLDQLGSSAQIGITTENTAVPVVFAEANGTNYANRFTPDNAGYSIGYNASQQLQLQNKTYTVTYASGADGTGDSKTVNKEHDRYLELEGALFTRLGYTQVGWSKIDGGEMDYGLQAIYEQNADLTLYPVWQERSDYTIHIVNRDGTTVKDLENVKWTDVIWDLLTPRPRRDDDMLSGLRLGERRVSAGQTYGDFAVNGEDSLTFAAVWSGYFIDRSVISVGNLGWSGFRAEGTERFFKDDQDVTITVPYPEEFLALRYAVSDRYFADVMDADRNLKSGDYVDYTGTFSTKTLNLEEGKPYVLYCYLFTESKNFTIMNTDKIIIDKTAPTITGARDGDVFCGQGDKTITVTDLYLDTVTVNGTAVTPNEQGEITLTDARTLQTVVATDKAGNAATLTVTVHSAHSYKWQTENGQYWGECEFCGSKVEKTDIPVVTITAPDAVCRTQDFEFSFNLPEGCTNPSYSYEFTFAGDGEPVTPVDGVCSGTIDAGSYMAEENSFRFTASVTTADGYRVSVSKNIAIRAHSGGAATCTERAVCDRCGQSYGELKAHTFTAEKAEAQYLKSNATCTEKAVYYKSCAACGATSKGTDSEAIFESGNARGHEWSQWMPGEEGTHSRVCARDAGHIETVACTYGDWETNRYSHWRTCKVCGAATERLNHSDQDDDHFCDTCGKQMTEHDFTAEKADAKYLKSEATCLASATYYKSCAICGLSSKGTDSEAVFEAGEKNPDHHTGTPGEWQCDGDSHWKVYSCCHAETEKGAHHGGAATCTAQAICEDCKTAYGELAAHDFTAEKAEKQYLKSAATCTERAVYYKSCASCGLSAKGTDGEATFQSGDVLGHDFGAWSSNGDGTHTRVCSRDASHTETKDCRGGTATCTAQAICADCKAAYGELDPAHHAAGCVPEWVTTETTHEQKYTLCGKVTVAETAHRFGDWTVLQEPAAGQSGQRVHTCSDCAYEQTETIPATGRFVDVPAGSYYEEAVIWAAGEGIANGTDQTHFSPDAFCTRAQAVTFLWRAAGSPAPKSTAMPFADVSSNRYYYNAVLWAVENGITKGTSSTAFSPDLDCSRAQMVTLLWRAEGSPAAGGSNPFTDVATGVYYTDAVLWAAENGIVKGTSSTTFSPNAGCTRGQIVTFLWRWKK